jgi:methionine synthase II (cobalamin-independent)
VKQENASAGWGGSSQSSPHIRNSKASLIVPGLETAMQAELASILAHIPAADLAIQWDCAVEVALTEQAFGWTTETPMPELVARTVAALAPRIPADVMLGYHLCFGTLGGWPMHRPKSLGSCVALARVVLEASQRTVDYIHMPVLDGADDSYFAPLKSFKAPDTKIYLGVIHHMDDRAEFTRLVSAAARSIANFGIAAPCGFGREPRPAAGLLKEHVDAMAALRALRT